MFCLVMKVVAIGLCARAALLPSQFWDSAPWCKIARSGRGGCVEVEFSGVTSVHLYYVKVPESSGLVLIAPATILLYDSQLLRGLCQLSSLNVGKITTWTCKSRRSGRLDARCSFSGHGRKSEGTGIRDRSSEKVGSLARVTTVSQPESIAPTLLPAYWRKCIRKVINLDLS